METNGLIPDGLFVLHRCDNPSCVRSDHLFLGTNQDNVADMQAKKRGPLGDRHWSRRRPELVLRGNANGSAKIAQDIALAILTEYATELISQSKLAKKYGISQQHVSKIVRGERWAHLE